MYITFADLIQFSGAIANIVTATIAVVALAVNINKKKYPPTLTK